MSKLNQIIVRTIVLLSLVIGMFNPLVATTASAHTKATIAAAESTITIVGEKICHWYPNGCPEETELSTAVPEGYLVKSVTIFWKTEGECQINEGSIVEFNEFTVEGNTNCATHNPDTKVLFENKNLDVRSISLRNVHSGLGAATFPNIAGSHAVVATVTVQKKTDYSASASFSIDCTQKYVIIEETSNPLGAVFNWNGKETGQLNDGEQDRVITGTATFLDGKSIPVTVKVVRSTEPCAPTSWDYDYRSSQAVYCNPDTDTIVRQKTFDSTHNPWWTSTNLVGAAYSRDGINFVDAGANRTVVMPSTIPLTITMAFNWRVDVFNQMGGKFKELSFYDELPAYNALTVDQYDVFLPDGRLAKAGSDLAKWGHSVLSACASTPTDNTPPAKTLTIVGNCPTPGEDSNVLVGGGLLSNNNGGIANVELKVELPNGKTISAMTDANGFYGFSFNDAKLFLGQLIKASYGGITQVLVITDNLFISCKTPELGPESDSTFTSPRIGTMTIVGHTGEFPIYEGQDNNGDRELDIAPYGVTFFNNYLLMHNRGIQLREGMQVTFQLHDGPTVTLTLGDKAQLRWGSTLTATPTMKLATCEKIGTWTGNVDAFELR